MSTIHSIHWAFTYIKHSTLTSTSSPGPVQRWLNVVMSPDWTIWTARWGKGLGELCGFGCLKRNTEKWRRFFKVTVVWFECYTMALVFSFSSLCANIEVEERGAKAYFVLSESMAFVARPFHCRSPVCHVDRMIILRGRYSILDWTIVSK